MNGENQQLVTDELVEAQDLWKVTDRFGGNLWNMTPIYQRKSAKDVNMKPVDLETHTRISTRLCPKTFPDTEPLKHLTYQIHVDRAQASPLR